MRSEIFQEADFYETIYGTFTALRCKCLIINGAGEGNRTLVSGNAISLRRGSDSNTTSSPKVEAWILAGPVCPVCGEMPVPAAVPAKT